MIKQIYLLIILQYSASDERVRTYERIKTNSQGQRRARDVSKLTGEEDVLDNPFDITLLSKTNAKKEQNILLLRKWEL